MKVLMFGWEFPPVMSGGLGTVCYGLTRALAQKGIQVTFVMPNGPQNLKGDFVNLIVANNIDYKHIRIKKIDSLLMPYLSFQSYKEIYTKIVEKRNHPTDKPIYGSNLYEEVWRFSELAKIIAQNEDFDIIHCHDWLTVDAGIKAKEISGKPLILHAHNLAFDRGAGHANSYEYDIEKRGFDKADKIIAISNRVKNMIVERYFINPNKIEVIHWGIDQDHPSYAMNYKSPLGNYNHMVLFLGRITIQKGPDYFVEAAKKVLKYVPNTIFVFAGSGDMEPQIIKRVSELGIGDKVLFTGFVKGQEVFKAYQMADVFVMPSVSEPFGMVALEAMRNNTPIIISKQSGVSEVVRNCLKIDFWDIDEMANKIIGILKYKHLKKEIQQEGMREVQKLTYEETADKVIGVYHQFILAPYV